MMNEKKKRKKEKKYENQLKEKKNKHMCVCAQYSPSLGVYIDV